MSAPAQERPALRHDGIFYDDDSFLASTAVRFVREGLEARETVMVNTGANPVTLLLRALFEAEPQVVFAERSVYDSPVAALDAYRRIMDRAVSRDTAGYRAMGHIDFARSRLPWQEWLRYEAAVNRVFDGYPLRTLCPYDVTQVPPEIVDAMRRAHSGLVTEHGWQPNPEYVEPELLVVRDGLVTPAHPVQLTPPRMVLEPGDDLVDLRLELYNATLFTDLPRRRVDDLVAAVSELVANAHEHGTPPVLLRLWADDEGVVCTVTDQGPGLDDPLAGYDRGREPEQGLGLWGVRQLCDVVDFVREEGGFTVRTASFV